jgi:hypothetical protein
LDSGPNPSKKSTSVAASHALIKHSDGHTGRSVKSLMDAW